MCPAREDIIFVGRTRCLYLLGPLEQDGIMKMLFRFNYSFRCCIELALGKYGIRLTEEKTIYSMNDSDILNEGLY